MNEESKRVRIGFQKWNQLRMVIEGRIGLADHMLRYPKNTAEDIARYEGEKTGLTKALSYMDEIANTEDKS